MYNGYYSKEDRIKKKKKIIFVQKVLWLVSVTSVLTIILALASKYVGKEVVKAQGNIYTKHIIYSKSSNKVPYTQIDPARFPKEIETPTPVNPGEEDIDRALTPDGPSPSDVPLAPDVPSTYEPGTEIAYDFSVLMIFGERQFGGYITPNDLDDMKSMYDAYWENEMYWDMLEQDDQTGEISVYYAQNTEGLEQSALVAENYVEQYNIETTDGYASLFGHIRESVLKSSCVIGPNDTQDSGIREADIKYRMGRMLYRPAEDLLNITDSERYYSLCSAYTVLKDAFDHSSLDSTYAVDVAYDYLRVCNDIVDVMESGQSQEMIKKVKLAYLQFWERVRETSDASKYQSYCGKANEIIGRLQENN